MIRGLFLFCLSAVSLGRDLQFFDHASQIVVSKASQREFEILCEESLHQGYENREKMESIYRSRQRLKERIGDFFPKISMGTISSIASLSYFDLIPSLLGFLFPSNWFQWQEAKLLALAEKESFRTLLANNLVTLYSIHNDIDLYKRNYQITNFYYDQVKWILATIRMQKRQIKPEQESLVSEFKESLRFDLTVYKFGLKSLVPEIKFALGDKGNWNNFDSYSHSFSEIVNATPIHHDQHLGEVLFKSTEISAYDYLIEAAINGKQVKVYNFIDPTAGSPLGVGFNNTIKIAKSEIRSLEIQTEKTSAEMKLSLYNAVNRYNGALSQFHRARVARGTLRAYLDAMIQNTLNSTEDYDHYKMLQYYDLILKEDYRLSGAFHSFIAAQQLLDRLRWQGTLYEKVRNDDFVDSLIRSVKRF